MTSLVDVTASLPRQIHYLVAMAVTSRLLFRVFLLLSLISLCASWHHSHLHDDDDDDDDDDFHHGHAPHHAHELHHGDVGGDLFPWILG